MVSDEMRKKEKARWAEDRAFTNLQYPAEEVVRFLKRNFKNAKDKSILDFGCGSGRNIVPMIDMGFREIVAMDYNEGCLELTRKKANNHPCLRCIRNERLEIPLPSECLDGVVAWGALFYFTNDERDYFLREIYRVLKMGGDILCGLSWVK